MQWQNRLQLCTGYARDCEAYRMWTLRTDNMGESQNLPCSDLANHELDRVHITPLNAAVVVIIVVHDTVVVTVTVTIIVTVTVVNTVAGSAGEDGVLGDLHELCSIIQSGRFWHSVCS